MREKTVLVRLPYFGKDLEPSDDGDSGASYGGIFVVTLVARSEELDLMIPLLLLKKRKNTHINVIKPPRALPFSTRHLLRQSTPRIPSCSSR